MALVCPQKCLHQRGRSAMLGRVWGPTRFIPATGGCAGLPKALAISRALVYAPRVWVGVDDMTQASRRLALAHPTTRLPDYPTTARR